MTGPSRTALAAVVMALGLGIPPARAAAHAPVGPARVSMLSSAFDPPRVGVVAGDTVLWGNTSTQTHNLRSVAAGFDSGRIGPRGSYSRVFASRGSYPYACTIHAFMNGVVDVYDALLEAPARPVARGSAVTLHGRASLAAGQVRVQEDAGRGFADVAGAAPDGNGSFDVIVRPPASARYRTLTAGGAGPPITVLVAAPLSIRARLTRRRAVVTATAPGTPAGTVVVLQYYLRERFGWWPVRRARLGRSSTARFTVRRPPRGRRVRAVLTRPDAFTVTATSNVLRLRPLRR